MPSCQPFSVRTVFRIEASHANKCDVMSPCPAARYYKKSCCDSSSVVLETSRCRSAQTGTIEWFAEQRGLQWANGLRSHDTNNVSERWPSCGLEWATSFVSCLEAVSFQNIWNVSDLTMLLIEFLTFVCVGPPSVEPLLSFRNYMYQSARAYGYAFKREPTFEATEPSRSHLDDRKDGYPRSLAFGER
jgi:hypothetical protein